MFGIAWARPSMIFDARNSVRRLTIVTLEENFDRKVASSDDDRRAVLEERRVARRAVADPPAAELLLAGDPELLVLGAHRQDHRPRLELLLVDPHPVDPARLVRE